MEIAVVGGENDEQKSVNGDYGNGNEEDDDDSELELNQSYIEDNKIS